MREKFFSSWKKALFVIAFANATLIASPDEKIVYAQLSSYTTQIPNKELLLVHFENVEGISGIKLNAHNELLVQTPGTYVITFSGQAGSIGTGCWGKVNMWININQDKITCSYISETISKNSDTHGVSSHIILPLKAGDRIGVGVSSNRPNLGLVTLPLMNTFIPSSTLSVFKL